MIGIAELDQLADKPKEAEAGFQQRPGNEAGGRGGDGGLWAVLCVAEALARSDQAFERGHRLAESSDLQASTRRRRERSGDINGGLAAFNQLVGPEKAATTSPYLLAQDGRKDVAAQECRAALAINPKFEPSQTMLDQLQGGVAAIPRHEPTAADSCRPPATAGPSNNGMAPVALGDPNQKSARATQASWQGGTTGSNGFGTASPKRIFDPALPKAAS